MAEIYRYVRGMKLEELIAHTAEAQVGLTAETAKVAETATKILASHRHDGDSRIETEELGIDRMVVLSDERGQLAAMTIEYGRKGGGSNGAMQPVAPLHKAVKAHVIKKGGKR